MVARAALLTALLTAMVATAASCATPSSSDNQAAGAPNPTATADPVADPANGSPADNSAPIDASASSTANGFAADNSAPIDASASGTGSTPGGPATGAATATATATELGARPLPTTPQALARELSEVEGELGRDGLDAATARPFGLRQQLLYRTLSAHPDWVPTVTAQIDPAVHDVVALNLDARVNLSALVRSAPIAANLPAWDIRAPRPADELLGYYQEAAQATGVSWPVLAAVNLVETRMGRINGTSTAGAVGPMQFLPSTWARCCTGDPADDHDAIVGAAHYLAARGAPANLDKALYSYNHSDCYVQAVKDYAAIIGARQQRYYGFHAWEVVFQTTIGLVQLPVGYHQTEQIDAATWLQSHPDALVAPA